MGKTKKKTILVVDDEPINIEILTEILEKDYNVKVAINGEMALKVANSAPVPDLILLDIVMPDIKGYDVCKQLKAGIRTADIPVIFVTSLDQDADEAAGFDAGGVDYITKPVNPGVTLRRVATHLALHDQNLALESRVIERTRELRETRLQIIESLGQAAEYHLDDRGLSVVRMRKITEQVALSYGLNTIEAGRIATVVPMHDIGKIGIPHEILRKQGELNADDWKIIKQHPHIGARIIGEHNDNMMLQARSAALTHHEHWDGGGYPEALQGEGIPLLGRITAVADVFSALTTSRPYREAWSLEDAFTHIEERSETQFDPQVVAALLTCRSLITGICQHYAD